MFRLTAFTDEVVAHVLGTQSHKNELKGIDIERLSRIERKERLRRYF